MFRGKSTVTNTYVHCTYIVCAYILLLIHKNWYPTKKSCHSNLHTYMVFKGSFSIFIDIRG